MKSTVLPGPFRSCPTCQSTERNPDGMLIAASSGVGRRYDADACGEVDALHEVDITRGKIANNA